MLELTQTRIRKWADTLKIKDLRLAELDLRLLNALKAICSDSFLSERLYLKGGTVLNKLYLKETARLSVDLDFNAIGEKEQVLQERKAIRLRIIQRFLQSLISLILHPYKFQFSVFKPWYQSFLFYKVCISQ